ncbi:error-prone DNA polymerase [Prauserella marina]|uniref:Error-prone DNA polymerase n=1 Tax=Prauserella marina TaxID=530584 RepID=A0A222VJS8_9PSEU|nr:error-prone DNA polymerase [Prauserella marina]ASR34178.1 error-prone DNA polymerase [Prauserella marina]PWV70508.1 DnaE-like error-prone DNA polymerase [Prauserella marina]SDE03720.1 error-prone DNA polymerase [Prauserella marina]
MGFGNPPVPWRDLSRTLDGGTEPVVPEGDGNDSPAWGRHRERYLRPADLSSRGDDGGGAIPRTPYAELHCHSNFSFLDGVSHPEELVEEAARLGLDAVAITDHDGMYGVARFAEAAREVGIRTVFGTELSLGLSGPQNGVADPEGEHLLLLAKGQDGYASLCRAITAGQLRGHDKDLPASERAEKGRPVYDLDAIAAEVSGNCAVLTGCRKGAVRTALTAHGKEAAAVELRSLVDRFGTGNVYVELIDHGRPLDSTHNDALAEIAAELGVPTVATNAVHYATPDRARLAQVAAAIRARRGLDEMEGWLPSAGTAHLRSGAEMAARFARYPGAVQRSALLGAECAFDLKLVAPELPPYEVPEGYDEASLLREKVLLGAARRYGAEGGKNDKAYRQIEHELKVIEERRFPGYFLIVWDIVRFCDENDILCQGRGSAANSAVCYALGITKIDPVEWNLLFERFLAPDRDGYPDIDLDIESDRREKVIQYVYEKYGRLCTAQVANVITYRARSAVRDAARALGHSPGQQDAWSKQIDRWGPLRATRSESDHDIPEPVLAMAASLEDFPRHLGIHSGGMVICNRPVSEVCPIEWARMENRSVLQWEKDDCASVGLVKFDLLGLGMLSALHYMIDLVREHEGVEVDLSRMPLEDQNIYDMLCRADAIGVFQVESRAQLATLPRLAPRNFYALAIEVALIRPGPIQGGSVHPYIRRYTKKEKWEHDHPLLANALDKTLGVPLFQEQMMQIALDVAGFTAAEADELRHAMGAKRSGRKMERLRQRFYEGAARNGVDERMAERIFQKMRAFSNFGFPESHALSFAGLVFASAYFKYYHPEAFCAGLLRAQPMGFYSPQSLVADARRHGVTVRGPDVNASLPDATLEPLGENGSGLAVRIGLGTIRTIGGRLAERLVAERDDGGIFRDMADVARRVRLTTPQVEALATAGAFGCFEQDRRRALWAAGAVAEERPEKIPGSTPGVAAPTLPGMDDIDHAAADVWATGLSPDSFPTQFIRDRLDALGVVTAERLRHVEDGRRVLIGGAVTHRQRPATAGGITFINIEDETGMVNVICTAGLWQRYHRIARSSPALLVRGVVEKADGVVSLLADRLQHLPMRITQRSRDFR